MTPHQGALAERVSDSELGNQPALALVKDLGIKAVEIADHTATEKVAFLDTEVYRKHHDFYQDPDDPTIRTGTCEVFVESDLTLEDYEAVTPAEDWQRLDEYAEEMRGKKLVFINATPAGGGVAIMRGPLVHLLRLKGVDAHWYALTPNPEAAKVTKGKFHNVLQAVSEPEVRLTLEDKKTYEAWIEENAKLLKEPIESADVLCMDDWQPSALIRHIKGDGQTTGLNPDAPLLFRDHIHTEGQLMSTPGTPQYGTWNYLWNSNRINEADVFITHPRDEFVPQNVPDEKVVFMPATGDYLDDLNRQLTEEERQAGFDFINDRLAKNEGQKPIDPNRPYVVLIARFDESKGMPQGLESYVKARQKLIENGLPEDKVPQLVIIGNGSVDDPSGKPELAKMMRIRAEQKPDVIDDLKIARVPHNDMAINAVLKGAKLAIQPSTKEGFESRVTDAILQGVPVLGSDRGGIPLQIIPGESGYIIDPHNTDKWAEYITELMTNDIEYARLRHTTAAAAKSLNYEFTTVPNAINWLYLATTTLKEKENFVGNRQSARKMAIAASRAT